MVSLRVLRPRIVGIVAAIWGIALVPLLLVLVSRVGWGWAGVVWVVLVTAGVGLYVLYVHVWTWSATNTADN